MLTVSVIPDMPPVKRQFSLIVLEYRCPLDETANARKRRSAEKRLMNLKIT
jgi:hypothetical protein